MIYFCCDARRRDAVKAHPTLNGIDFLEVSDDPADADEDRQRTLFVHFLKELAPGALEVGNVRIEGGDRIRDIAVTSVAVVAVGSPPGSPPTSPPGSPPGADGLVLQVVVSQAGDFSTYTLRLTRDAHHADPPDGYDPVLSGVDFSFKVACPSEFDCKPRAACPVEEAEQPDISYLAKDYASFRQLMLDRIATLAPQWRERNPADAGVALVELLAYVGDYLSYQQDAVATEAYLGTARRRTSLRRHARLVDYTVGDGCNARTWVHVQVRADVGGLPLTRAHGGQRTRLFTRVEGQPTILPVESLDEVTAARPEVFELLHDVTLFAAHNELRFYTWGDAECCLPKGATRATLRGTYPDLAAGDVLILAEVRGPHTGAEEDADNTRRHAVRLASVETLEGDGGPRRDPLTGQAITDIRWDDADALPFPLCISARTGTAFYDDLSVAFGNVVLADHGETVVREPLPVVPRSRPELTKVTADGEHCRPPAPRPTPPRFSPRLGRTPVTQAAGYDPTHPPASAWATTRPPADDVLAAITLTEPGIDEPWLPRADLLESGPSDRHFVVEVETDGAAFLRFGDDQFGSRPAADTALSATYRVGNGTAGNVGADALAHIASVDPAIVTDKLAPVIVALRNPLPARGGRDPETMDEIRRNAPSAFKTQERAVTPDDYGVKAQGCLPDVQRAAATFRWTGSWRTVFVTVDRARGSAVDDDYKRAMRAGLERYRMAGHDIDVDGPRYVPLEIEMVVCARAGYLASDVKAVLRDTFSERILPDGRRGLFHPDAFTFGQPVYLSPLYAAAQAIDGVDAVDIPTFRRQGTTDDEARAAGKLVLGRLEIARLANDPDFPEHGVFRLTVEGGR